MGGNSNAGGIICSASGSIIEKCTVSGKVLGKYGTGGIIASFGNFSGIFKDFPSEAPTLWAQLLDQGIGIRERTNTAEICSETSEAGGIVATIFSSTSLGFTIDQLNHYEYWAPTEIADCTNSGDVSGYGGITGTAGGICGGISTNTKVQDEKQITETWSIINRHNSGNIYGEDNTGSNLKVGGNRNSF